MRMNPGLLVVGGLLVFWAAFIPVVAVPTYVIPDTPSETWVEPTPTEQAGFRLYLANGCTYCHSMYIRPQDWCWGATRIAQAGDYHRLAPHQLGSMRTGPDLSQEGGQHTDDWHLAHFMNPRSTRPDSIMPRFGFLGATGIAELTAYLQGQGGTHARLRMARQAYWHPLAVAAYEAGADANVKWLHDSIPEPWRAMPNPHPATPASLARGEKVYQSFCIGCHGPIGDGVGKAADYLYPPALNFTVLRRNLVEGRYIGGILYYQIMNGITGTAMPYFKYELESEKIWDVSNYVAVNFVGWDDSNLEPRGIDAAGEVPGEGANDPPLWKLLQP